MIQDKLAAALDDFSTWHIDRHLNPETSELIKRLLSATHRRDFLLGVLNEIYVNNDYNGRMLDKRSLEEFIISSTVPA